MCSTKIRFQYYEARLRGNETSNLETENSAEQFSVLCKGKDFKVLFSVVGCEGTLPERKLSSESFGF